MDNREELLELFERLSTKRQEAVISFLKGYVSGSVSKQTKEIENHE